MNHNLQLVVKGVRGVSYINVYEKTTDGVLFYMIAQIYVLI